MSTLIRDAELSDAASLATLMTQLGYKTTETEMVARLNQILPDKRFKTLVAVADGRVCGMIGTITRASYEHNDPSGGIMALVVSNAMRRHGIGRNLIGAAEKDFAQRKIKRVAVNTRLKRKEAHLFYESLGYECNGWRFVKELES